MSTLTIPIILLASTVGTLAALFVRLRADVFRRQNQTLCDELEALDLDLDLYAVTHDLTDREEKWDDAFRTFFASARAFLTACSAHKIFTVGQLQSFLATRHPRRLSQQKQEFLQYLTDGMLFVPFPPHANFPEAFNQIQRTFNESIRSQPAGHSPLEIFAHDYIKASEDSRKRQRGFPGHFGISSHVSSSEVA